MPFVFHIDEDDEEAPPCCEENKNIIFLTTFNHLRHKTGTFLINNAQNPSAEAK